MTAAPSSPSRQPPAPIPLTLITGFLGAGKTTLLNGLLKNPALKDTAVVINEFGEIALDHLMVERIDGDMMVLASGCLCCTLRGDLVEALEKLLRNLDNGRASFRRVVIETTGLADPAPLLQTAMSHPYLVMRYRLDGVVTLVDAVNGFSTLDEHPESVKQAAVADRIVLTKTDLLTSPEQIEAKAALTDRLRRLNPAAQILDAAQGEAVPDTLLNCGLYNPDRKTPDVKRWLAEEAYQAAQIPDHAHHHHNANRHDDRVQAFAIATDTPVPASVLELFLELLRATHGNKLLRLKGIVKLAEAPDTPVVVHGVQHILHPTAQLAAWPDDDRRTRMVFIVRDIEPHTIREMFDAFMGHAAPDRPDQTAMVDNPLVPFGGRDR